MVVTSRLIIFVHKTLPPAHVQCVSSLVSNKCLLCSISGMHFSLKLVMPNVSQCSADLDKQTAEHDPGALALFSNGITNAGDGCPEA